MDEFRDPPPPPEPDPGSPDAPTLRNSLRRHGAGRVVFGRFRLVRELGAGGMAVVWLAQDERLGLEVALKFLPGMVAGDPEALHDLRREITRGLRLTHPGIVRVYDLQEDAGEGLAAIAMEYVDGSTLAEEKARRPGRCFEVAEPLLTWTRTLCQTLSYVHEKARVVHRDLKPRNLMLTTDGELKVADFGIAATLSDSHSRLTQRAGSSGTPVYMSPQQAQGRSPSTADDVYAIGATLYEMITSKPPFFRGTTAVILHQLATEIPPSMRERREELGVTGRGAIPHSWEATIAACLAKNPVDRPSSVREVAERLGSTGKTVQPYSADLFDEERTVQARDSKPSSREGIPSPRERGTPPLNSGDPALLPPPVVAQPPSESESPPDLAAKSRTVRAYWWMSAFAAMALTAGLGFYLWQPNERKGMPVPTTTPAPNASPAPGAVVEEETPESGTPARTSYRLGGARPTTTSGAAAEGDTPQPVPQPSAPSPEPAAPVAATSTPIPPLPPPARATLAYTGTIRNAEDPKATVPLTIRFDSSLRAGTMTQRTSVGDTVVLFSGTWRDHIFQGHTGDVVSKPTRVKWDEESFILAFPSNGQTSTYTCTAGGRTYRADLRLP
ncbi:MAG TPA: protein kinase [Chthoniobacteraceae bacterium]|nr:protein kinase [Chthoniobacteraceae bacterium]